MTTKYAFKRCSLNLLEELFDVCEVPDMQILHNWLTQKVEISGNRSRPPVG